MMSTIGPVGSSSYGSGSTPPDDASTANALRKGITSFSESIQSGNPDSGSDVDNFAQSILDLHSQISGRNNHA